MKTAGKLSWKPKFSPKMNMVVGKRQIILAALILGLSVAVYLNWTYSDFTDQLPVTNLIEQKNYGDAQYVDGQGLEDTQGEAYFAQAKLTRTRSRDEAVETLKGLLDSAEISDEQRAELALQAAALAGSIETEGKIENLIKAKGFNDCMVYYDTEKVDVIVKTNGLLSTDVVQMKDIILKETDIPVENIYIVEVK